MTPREKPRVLGVEVGEGEREGQEAGVLRAFISFTTCLKSKLIF
jgi:hypothetical protein